MLVDTSFLLKPDENIKGQGWGYLDPSNMEISDMWVDISRIVSAKYIVELGMFAGHSTVSILEHFPESDVLSLDHGTFSVDASVPIKEKYGERFEFCKSRFVDYKSIERKIDLVFVDAGHTYDSIKRDISKILIEKPSYILFDNVELPGVRKALNEINAFDIKFNPKFWYYTNRHKEKVKPGIMMLINAEEKYDEILRLL